MLIKEVDVKKYLYICIINKKNVNGIIYNCSSVDFDKSILMMF